MIMNSGHRSQSEPKNKPHLSDFVAAELAKKAKNKTHASDFVASRFRKKNSEGRLHPQPKHHKPDLSRLGTLDLPGRLGDSVNSQ